MTTRQRVKAFSVVAGICAAFSPCLAAGAKQAANPKITAHPKMAVHNTTHRLNVVFYGFANAGAKDYGFLWSSPERPGYVWDAPPQWWIDAIPSGDTVEVNMPFYPNLAWAQQRDALWSACVRKHITVKLTEEPYKSEGNVP